MIRLRAFLLFASVLSVSTTALIACSSDELSRVVRRDAGLGEHARGVASARRGGERRRHVGCRRRRRTATEARLRRLGRSRDSARAHPARRSSWPERVTSARSSTMAPSAAGETTARARSASATSTEASMRASVRPPLWACRTPRRLSAAEFATCARNADGGVLRRAATGRGSSGSERHPLSSIRSGIRRPPRSCSRRRSLASTSAIGASARSARAATPTAGAATTRSSSLGRMLERSTVGGPGAADLHGFEVTRTGAGLTSVFGLTNDGRLLGWGAVSGREGSITPTRSRSPSRP